jgi:TetR/AcrR family hemagglutinin/protease transcriptional regulator
MGDDTRSAAPPGSPYYPDSAMIPGSLSPLNQDYRELKLSATEKASPKPRARRMSPAERQDQILGCAIKAFASKGIDNATHADVAALAGVSVPTVFHYFSTIEVLQEQVLVEVRRFLLDGFVLTRMHLHKPSYQIIEEMLVDFRDAVKEHTEYIRIWLEWSGSSRGAIWDQYLSFYDDATKALKRLIMKGRRDNSISPSINAGDAARIILGMAHTIAHMSLSGSSNKTVHSTIQALVLSYIQPHEV